MGVLVRLQEGSVTLALERVLELIVGGGTDGGVLMSDKSMAMGFRQSRSDGNWQLLTHLTSAKSARLGELTAYASSIKTES